MAPELKKRLSSLRRTLMRGGLGSVSQAIDRLAEHEPEKQGAEFNKIIESIRQKEVKNGGR